MLNFIKQSLSSIYHNVTSKLNVLFSRSTVDSQTLEELKKLPNKLKSMGFTFDDVQ